jgi:hypothetical protein
MTTQHTHLHHLPSLTQQVPQPPPGWRVQHVLTKRLQVALLRRVPTDGALHSTAQHSTAWQSTPRQEDTNR